MNIPRITSIKRAKEKKQVDFIDKELYKLCQDYPQHTESDVILAKVLIIGRTYSAAIDRNKAGKEGKDIYKGVIKTILNADLDSHLRRLREMKVDSAETMRTAIELHKYLERKLRKITLDNKTSFCSKYLHFHQPNLFFLYDTRSVKGMSRILRAIPKNEKLQASKKGSFNSKYAIFYQKCSLLQRKIRELKGVYLTHRQIDHLLIGTPNHLII